MSTQPHEDSFHNVLLDRYILVVISRSVRLVLLHDIHTLLYTSYYSKMIGCDLYGRKTIISTKKACQGFHAQPANYSGT